MPAAFNKFNAFVQAVGRKQDNLHTDTLKIMLTNTAPVATNSLYSDISGTELASGNGYTTGGTAVASNAYSHTSGTAKLTGNKVVWTATGSMGPFRYCVLYDSTSGDLIGWWDYGSGLTLTSAQTFTVGNSNDGTNWTSTYSICSVQ